jgi:hypothetical protein
MTYTEHMCCKVYCCSVQQRNNFTQAANHYSWPVPKDTASGQASPTDETGLLG